MCKDATDILPDLLRPGLKVVFCGTAAGAASRKAGAYYAGPGNKFWRTLHTIGLTPTQLTPENFPDLLNYGIGLTDLSKTGFGADVDLAAGSFDVVRFGAAIAAAAPTIVAFNGMKAARVFMGLQSSAVAYGVQSQSAIPGQIIAILPSTSGAASGFWSIKPWRELAKYLDGLR
ncbi:mismatch-specific DNA-glycosylase [Acidisphaera sp. L21]|uniref:mismatch-specific DNA-glycosylase n=1 Tax=Acidisphaera sp. L21 TaxID=1641851 RepID=UPI00131D4BF7|nr:mismatch-specific DNA-glycosylase [Acidisphaera sp. L21]